MAGVSQDCAAAAAVGRGPNPVAGNDVRGILEDHARDNLLCRQSADARIIGESLIGEAEPDVISRDVAVNHRDVVFTQKHGSRWADYAEAAICISQCIFSAWIST
jgi:hypothetical protein